MLLSLIVLLYCLLACENSTQFEVGAYHLRPLLILWWEFKLQYTYNAGKFHLISANYLLRYINLLSLVFIPIVHQISGGNSLYMCIPTHTKCVTRKSEKNVYFDHNERGEGGLGGEREGVEGRDIKAELVSLYY